MMHVFVLIKSFKIISFRQLAKHACITTVATRYLSCVTVDKPNSSKSVPVSVCQLFYFDSSPQEFVLFIQFLFVCLFIQYFFCVVMVCVFVFMFFYQYENGKWRSNAQTFISQVPVIEVDGHVALCDGGITTSHIH